MAEEQQSQQDGGSSGLGFTPYLVLWIVALIVLIYEYLIMNKMITGPSLFLALNKKHLLLPGQKLSPEPGGPLSFRMGWIGFGIICMTNLYILRKKLPRMRTWGKIPGWLDFHIFCGLMGPTLIVFHTNMKVGGLVAVSFWSMMISFASGVFGRYFYMQLLGQRVELKQQLRSFEDGFKSLPSLPGVRIGMREVQAMKEQAMALAGITPVIATGKADLLTVVLQSITGDLRLMMRLPAVPDGLPPALGLHLKQYALVRRQHMTTSYYKRIMGYWHAFHFPFAIFMYVVSVLHIISALVFRVNH